MFRTPLLLGALAISFACAGATQAARLPTLPVHPAPKPGEVLVVLPSGESFARGAHGEVVATGARRAALLAREGLVPARLLGAGNADRRTSAALGNRFALLRGARPDFDPVAAAARLRASGLFVAATPNFPVRLTTTLPNDPYLGDEWWIQDLGGSDLQLPLAWDVTTGSPSQVIAILDTGVDTGHPDLASKIWHNPGEIPANGVDDDGNGYVDDVMGWDFGNLDADPNPGPIFDEIGIDIGFHGTFCAGLAAASSNNAVGIAGAAWGCPIMALRIFSDAGDAGTVEITDAIAYAIDNGADVISMSFGAPDEPGLPEFFQALIDAADAAGIVCVASAGNDGVDAPLVYPAACDHVISVGACNSANARSEFSNWGAWVDVAAPGEFMWSTIARNYEIDELNQIFYLYFFYWDGENPYMEGDGTSFAAPLVAGVAALVRSVMPGLDSDAMEAHLIATGTTVPYDLPIGPRVNAAAAVTTPATAVGPAPLAGLALGAPRPNPAAGISRLSFSLPSSGRASLAIFDAAGRLVRSLDRGVLAAGTHEAAWSGVDESGGRAPAGLYFARLEFAGRVISTRIVRLDR